jgi:signal-transduction protein with cAMP-binding, CBS, and nucleotidyltransferase domain
MAISKIPEDLISETLTVDYRTPITSVIAGLAKYPAVVVSKNNGYYGMIDSRAVYRSGQNLKLGRNETLEKFAVRVPKVTSSTTVDDLIYYFYRSRVKALPYYNGSRISGVLERATLLKMMLSMGMLKDMKVREAMTTPVLAIDAGASISQARATMRNNRVNRLVVLDNEKFAGLLTNYDIMQGYTKVRDRLPERSRSDASGATVEGVMERNPRLIDYDKGLSDAVRELVENSISSVLVMKKGRPVGMLTVMDVLESVVAKRRIEERRIFISGLDADSYQYSDEIREELRTFVEHAEKLSRVKIDYVTMRVKKVGNKAYEIQVRMSMGNKGIINLNTTEPSFQESLSDIMVRLKERLMKEKDKMLTVRKINVYR